MSLTNLQEIEEREVAPGYLGRFVSTENMTAAYWTISEGSPLPEHAHVAEQMVNVTEGVFELTVEGVAHRLEPGMVYCIASNVPHSGMAITDCKIIDIFSPVREEYR